ncbi:hypothetical protein CAPTEDRAFT_154442 [Capitella teleta]|uniref:Major facilitator superfamily (MFS) profile domain-containing protein n=1 Tax=Capitella teleta TaxID=283909 RepID=R7TB59_CAPTE|nr:hypothetical protein CAPTEDRAFT_154442 [Capitella teleta]|eukprot:ELT90968.1 hypothetical protein CAPTEDRAFT_154442 [Capitella teleta]
MRNQQQQNMHISPIPEGVSLSSLDSLPSRQQSETHPGGGVATIEMSSEELAAYRHSRWRYGKNLVVLTLSFILVFTAFRSIQNLQSSLNSAGRLGMVAMACVHGTTFLTCLFAPALIDRLTSKWTIVLGLLFYLFWVAANFYPHVYTLVPTSIGVGFGQSLAWGAQVTYIQKLAVDYAHASRELTQQEMYKFNGVFLACFQTSHVWGNLVSSLMLTENSTKSDCGIYDRCSEEVHRVWNISSGLETADDTVLKLMGSYLVFAFTGFALILICLERIGTKADPEKPCLQPRSLQMVWRNVQQLVKHKTYRLLIPLLIFNGFEQGFVYADYNKSYITCSIGIHYVGYNMITLGMTNSLFSVLIGMVSKHLPREAIVGMGAILHIGLMVFLLVWIPDVKLVPVFFAVSALWGICDAIWQTQCNCLVNLSCPDDHDVAFQNFRMLQGLGASMAFGMGAFTCVSAKLYFLITLLSLAVLLYAAVEYQLRKAEEEEEYAAQNHGRNLEEPT